MASPPDKHASNSSEQRSAEAEIFAGLEKQLDVRLDGRPDIASRLKLDGFSDGETPICVEIWAHQGKAIGSQPDKVMADMCKLLLVEKLIEKRCRKIFAVCDESALGFLQNSWQGQFADKFGIELKFVHVDEATRDKVRKAQERQYR